jgi:lysophospholipase
MKTLFAALAILPVMAHAISEKNYQQDYDLYVRPLWSRFEVKQFSGEKNISINYATWRSSAAAESCLVILPGRTEQIEKYAEVVHDLESSSLAGKYTYILMDHRGQGSSGRMIKQSDKGHVDSFDNYTKDLMTLMTSVVKPLNCKSTHLIAHSMGGGISVDFMQKHPGHFEKVVLSSPMFKVLTKPYPYSIARSLTRSLVAFGRGTSFAPGQQSFDANEKFETNDYTGSQERFQMWADLFKNLPQTQVGGVTNRWLNEVMTGTNRIRANFEKVDAPVLMVTAEDERYSNPANMKSGCKQMVNCREMKLEGKHEVLMERDATRDIALREIEEFLN